MHEHTGPSRWAAPLIAVGLSLLVGAWTYNLGLAHGLAAPSSDARGWLRRSTALTRATSSRGLNGLVR